MLTIPYTLYCKIFDMLWMWLKCGGLWVNTDRKCDLLLSWRFYLFEWFLWGLHLFWRIWCFMFRTKAHVSRCVIFIYSILYAYSYLYIYLFIYLHSVVGFAFCLFVQIRSIFCCSFHSIAISVLFRFPTEPSPLYDNNHYHEECLRCNSCGINLSGQNHKRARRFKNQILCDLHFADVALMECSDFMQQLRSFKPQSLGCAVARRKSSTTLIFPLPPQACSGNEIQIEKKTYLWKST